jgi:hypothetical protein
MPVGMRALGPFPTELVLAQQHPQPAGDQLHATLARCRLRQV